MALFCRPAGVEFFARHVEAIDVSLGGLRIYSDEGHAIDALLRLDIFFPHAPPVTFTARVMWLTTLGKGAPARFEMGVAFVELSRYALTLLERAIGWAMPGGASEESPARAYASTAVEFTSDEPASRVSSVPPQPPNAADEADGRSMLSGTPPVLSGTPVVIVSAEALRAARLDSRAGFLLSLIDGKTTVESLLDLSGMPEHDTIALLDDLRLREIVAVRGGALSAPWVSPGFSVPPRFSIPPSSSSSIEMWPPSSDAPTAHSLQTGAPVAPDATAASNGFSLPAPRAKREWTLGLAALLVAGGLAVGAGVLPRRPPNLPALASAVRSSPARSVSHFAREDVAVPMATAAVPASLEAAPSSRGIPTQGLLDATQSRGRLYVDGLIVGETPTPVLVTCGKHVVKVGSAGREQSIDVPCGGAVIVAP